MLKNNTPKVKTKIDDEINNKLKDAGYTYTLVVFI